MPQAAGKNSRVRQTRKLSLAKTGRISKPALKPLKGPRFWPHFDQKVKISGTKNETLEIVNCLTTFSTIQVSKAITCA